MKKATEQTESKMTQPQADQYPAGLMRELNKSSFFRCKCGTCEKPNKCTWEWAEDKKSHHPEISGGWGLPHGIEFGMIFKCSEAAKTLA